MLHPNKKQHVSMVQIIKKYENSKLKVLTFNQSKFPRVLKDSFTPWPAAKPGRTDKAAW